MYIDNICLKNFRNYKNINLKLSPNLNIFVGENGVGKTNILEAISVVSNLKSFRLVSDVNLIKWGEESYFCEIDVKNNFYEKFSIGCLKQQKKFKKKVKLDNNKINKVSDYYGKLLTVVYSPDDINIINGNPEIRRKYFDGIISKVDNDYLKILSDFKKILAFRNKLLKEIKISKIKNKSELDVWDELFAEKASFLIKKRKTFIKEFCLIFEKEYSSIANEELLPKIIYKTVINKNEKDDILNKLVENRDYNIMLGTTSIGPQRDNYCIVGEDNNLFVNFASQGQKRTAAIALRNCEKKYIEKLSKKKAIILVDDVFADLDEYRRFNIIKMFYEENQVLITMVNKELLNIENITDSKYFNVYKNGKIEINEI